MSKIIGEAVLDSQTGKWHYVIKSDDGQVFYKSEPEFQTQFEAESEMVKILSGFGDLVAEYNSKK